MSGNVYKPSGESNNSDNAWEQLLQQNLANSVQEIVDGERPEAERVEEYKNRIINSMLGKGDTTEKVSRVDEETYYQMMEDEELGDNDVFGMLERMAGNEDVYRMLERIERPDQEADKKGKNGARYVANRVMDDSDGIAVSDKYRAINFALGANIEDPGLVGFSEFTVGNVYEEFNDALGFESVREDVKQKLAEYGLSNGRKYVPDKWCDAVFDSVRRALYGEQSDFLKAAEALYDKTRRYAEGEDVFVREQYEKEKEFHPVWEDMNSRNKLFRSASALTVSRGQLKNGIVDSGIIESGREDGESEDTAYGNGDKNVFAVFDGLGGEENGRMASRACAENMTDFLDKIDFTTDDGKKTLLEELGKNIKAGCTTATIAKIVQNERTGGKDLHYASVGDSRLYVVHQDGSAEQLTKDDVLSGDALYNKVQDRRLDKGNPMMDESFLRKVVRVFDYGDIHKIDIPENLQEVFLEVEKVRGGTTNSLGGHDLFIQNRENIGSVPVRDGDQIVLCSDGVTGDYGQQVVSTEEVGQIVHGRSAEDAVKNLVDNKNKFVKDANGNVVGTTQKFDDRTAIVVTV